MRNFFISMIALLAISTTLMAQVNPIQGTWVLTTVETQDETQDVYDQVIFHEEGSAEMSGMEFGSWEYNDDQRTLVIVSDMIQEFAGTWSVEFKKNNHLLAKNETAVLSFIKADPAKVEVQNVNSGLMGGWKSVDGESTTFLLFKTPDLLTIKTVGEGYTEETNGVWLYQKKENAIMMLIRHEVFKGIIAIESLGDAALTLSTLDGSRIFSKLEESTTTQETLDFTPEEIENSYYSEDEYALPEENKLPWKNSESLVNYMQNVQRINYSKSTTNEDLQLIDETEVTANVSCNADDYQLFVDEIFERISSDDQDGNYFYPLAMPDEFRVLGNREITVPAGTFNCSVVEAITNSGEIKMRVYMINNRPGVYAKLIAEVNGFGDKKIETYELTGIESSFTIQEDGDIIGEWLLVKKVAQSGTRIKSVMYDFVDDGRLSVTEEGGTRFFSWHYSAPENKVWLTANYDAEKIFQIENISEKSMILSNENESMHFVKFNHIATPQENLNTGLVGFWLLTNTAQAYNMLYLSEDNIVKEIRYFNNAQLEDNNITETGSWQNIDDEDAMVFYSSDMEAITMGYYNMELINENQLILRNDLEVFEYVRFEQETVAKNNKKSQLEGFWELTKDATTVGYYKLNSPYQLQFGRSMENLNPVGIWFYNPEMNGLFLGAAIPYLEGLSKITKIEKNTITFENGLQLNRVK